MISSENITTLNISSDKIKTFIFNRTVENPEAEARRFCRAHCMKFRGCKEAAPYSLHTWQHYAAMTFEAECTSRTSVFWYDYGKW